VASALIRRRAAQAIVLVVLLVFAPVAARELWPSTANFVPPALLLLLTALTVFVALAAWRPEWLGGVLFADSLSPERLARLKKQCHRQRVSAAIGLFVTGVLIAVWVKSLL
jgi:hypothetical protein